MQENKKLIKQLMKKSLNQYNKVHKTIQKQVISYLLQKVNVLLKIQEQ